MKRIFSVMIILCTLNVWAFAATEAELQQQFFKGSQAYNDQQYVESIDIFESLIQNGYGNQEIYYNLGNAYFRAGKTGMAIANYHRALFFDPTDPDVVANMHLAAERAKSINIEMGILSRILSYVGFSDWRLASMICLWGLAVSVAGFYFLPFRRLMMSSMIVFMLCTIFSVAGLGFWKNRLASGEAVMILPDVTARYAPLAEGKAFYKLTEGTIVNIVETKEGWVKIDFADRQGWVPKKSCEVIWE